MSSFAELLIKYMKAKNFTDGSLAEAINRHTKEIIDLINDPGHPLTKRIVTAESRRKKGITSEDFVVTRATIYSWRQAQVKHPRCRELLMVCGKVLELSAEQLDEFLVTAGHQSVNRLIQPPPPPPERRYITVTGVPISQPYQFFGRVSLLDRIRWAWDKYTPEHLVIIGPKRSGKTSLLNYLKNVVPAEYLRSSQPQGWRDWRPRNFKFVLVDFQEEVMCRPEGFRKAVLQQLLPQEHSDSVSPEHFSNVLRGQIGTKVVLLMDEFNLGWRKLPEEFWVNMRSLGSSGNVSLVVASSIRFDNLMLPKQSESSPFFNIFGHTLTLSTFTREEALELIAHSPQPLLEVDWLLRESHCWPALLQILCDAQLYALETGELNWKEEGLKRIESEFYRHLLELPGDCG